MAHKWKPKPRLENGELDWDTIERERREWHERRWQQLVEQRLHPERYPLAKIPMVVRAYRRY